MMYDVYQTGSNKKYKKYIINIHLLSIPFDLKTSNRDMTFYDAYGRS